MNWTPHLIRCALAMACAAALWGCSSSGSTRIEEEREPHFLEGKSRVGSMDFPAAVESFEQALEVNPHSSSAHFELACLLSDKEPDPAAAIYHYERYLKLRPGADNADIVKQRIYVLKQDLARTVMPPSATPAMQREFERLAEENRQLREQLDRSHSTMANRAATNTAGAGPASAGNQYAAAAPGGAGAASDRPAPAGGSAVSTRTHRVQAGETPIAVARKYGVKLDALLAVNPGLNPTRMRVGQTLNIPKP